MATTAAEAAGHPAGKEKVEKRRALGRGLESLLPGPRVATGLSASAAVVPRLAGGAAVQGNRAAEETEVPHFVRDDKDQSDAREVAAAPADVSAVVEMNLASRVEAPPQAIEIHAQADWRTPSNMVLQLPPA